MAFFRFSLTIAIICTVLFGQSTGAVQNRCGPYPDNTIKKVFNDISPHYIGDQYITETYDNGEMSTICWTEITTIKEFANNQSTEATREYAISFKSHSDIPHESPKDNQGVKKFEIFDFNTKKSKVLNFTTISTKNGVTISQHRQIICGSGPKLTKTYLQSTDKQLIEIKVMPKAINEEISLVRRILPDSSESSKIETIIPLTSVSKLTEETEVLLDLTEPSVEKNTKKMLFNHQNYETTKPQNLAEYEEVPKEVLTNLEGDEPELIYKGNSSKMGPNRIVYASKVDQEPEMISVDEPKKDHPLNRPHQIYQLNTAVPRTNMNADSVDLNNPTSTFNRKDEGSKLDEKSSTWTFISKLETETSTEVPKTSIQPVEKVTDMSKFPSTNVQNEYLEVSTVQSRIKNVPEIEIETRKPADEKCTENEWVSFEVSLVINKKRKTPDKNKKEYIIEPIKTFKICKEFNVSLVKLKKDLDKDELDASWTDFLKNMIKAQIPEESQRLYTYKKKNFNIRPMGTIEFGDKGVPIARNFDLQQNVPEEKTAILKKFGVFFNNILKKMM